MDDSEQDVDITPVNSTQPSRPSSPDSSLSNSFMRANATIDDLTANLAKVSRAPTPDTSNPLLCCCGNDECESTKAWIAHQAKLESRLILSAEVGQALLQRHEAYVRRNESFGNRPEADKHADLPPSEKFNPEGEDMLSRINQLMKENGALEKRLNTALLNNEVAEASTKVIMQELEDAKVAVSRLALNQAKSAGWEIRLNNVIQERDDLKQELDVDRQRVKSSDGHITVLKERCSKIQTEINQLHEELERQKCSRTELSEEILRDARARLQMLLQTRVGRSTVTDQPEVTDVMESLVADNEALKRDIAELQNLLAESREDVRTLREEMEEARMHVPSTSKDIARAIPSHIRTHHHTTSWGSSFGQDFRAISSPGLQHSLSSQVPVGRRGSPVVHQQSSDNDRRSSSAGPSTQSYEPPTPAASHRPLSPTDSNGPSETHVQSYCSPHPSYPASQLSIDVDKSQRDTSSEALAKPRTPRRPLFLLTQSRGVQTDAAFWPPAVTVASLRPPSFSDRSSSTPPPEGHSESSSLVDANASTIVSLVERVNILFSRIAQADARTLTNRLKRQHLTGDVGHLSRTTISAILADVNVLRRHFRGVLEDVKVVSTCTRRDFRSLLTLFKEIFTELAQMRLTLNDIILDPSVAAKVSEAAMNPTKGDDINRSKPPNGPGASLTGWMAPITKLFGSSSTEDKSADPATSSSRATPGIPHRPRPQFAATKQAPALAASKVAVNVEFSGVGTGRAVSTADSLPRAVAAAPATILNHDSSTSTKGVMGIFAGAPRPMNVTDPWIVVGPRPTQRLRNGASSSNLKTRTINRTAGRKMGSQRLSRNVDAVIDSESVVHDSDDEDDNNENNTTTLLERTLRPRGLSDSSIRSTFLDSAPKGEGPSASTSALPHTSTAVSAAFDGRPSARQGAYPNRYSVLASLSNRMQLFRGSTSVAGSSASVPNKRVSVPATAPEVFDTSDSTPAAHNTETPINPNNSDSIPPHPISPIRATSPRRLEILPSLAAWAASTAGLDDDSADAYVGSVQDEAGINAARSPPTMGKVWRGGREMDFE